jgi:hypothetical protein
MTHEDKRYGRGFDTAISTTSFFMGMKGFDVG